MATKIPSYSYTGTHSSELKGGYWYIYLKSSGTLKFTYDKKAVAACIVAGGAGGKAATGGDSGTPGGAGGAVKNLSGITCSAGTPYEITVGSGGAVGASGKASSAFSTTASGGTSGGGGTGGTSNGSGGAGSNGTYAFGDSSLPRYGADGGGGGARYGGGGSGGKGGGGNGASGGGPGYNGTKATAGTAYTGAGGGGAGGYYNDEPVGYGGAAAAGGYGIVILRGTEDDFLPVWFNGTQLSEMYMNGAKVETFIYDGTKIF